MAGVKGLKIVDTDRGYSRLVQQLGELGAVIIGVQGEDADKVHTGPRSEGITIGQLALRHELGLGVVKRSWLVDWIELNQKKMIRQTKLALTKVLKGKTTRNKELIRLGFAWTKDVRDRMHKGQVTPPITKATAARKGHAKPLIETYELHNHITYKVFLAQKKSIRDAAQRRVIK